MVAAVPSLSTHLFSVQTVRAAGEPLIALVLVAPLAAVMLVAGAGDWLRGRGSPLAAARQLSALALVAACFFAAVLSMESNLLGIVGGLLLIGGGMGLGIAFALGGNADSSGPLLAMVGWVGCAFPLLLQGFVAYVTDTCRPYDPKNYIYASCSAFGARETVCGGAFLLAIFIGVTVVPLGGRLGDQLLGRE